MFKLTRLVCEGERPKFYNSIPKCQQTLIESCWSQDPNKRPTFSEICSILRTEDFLKDVNADEFNMYVNYIEGEISFDAIKDRITKSNIFEIMKLKNLNEKIQSDNSNFYNFLDKNVIELSLKDYTRQAILGSGAFAKVFKV